MCVYVIWRVLVYISLFAAVEKDASMQGFLLLFSFFFPVTVTVPELRGSEDPGNYLHSEQN